MTQIFSSFVVVFSCSRTPINLAVGLLIALTACSNSPTGRTLQDSLAADPRLTENAAPLEPTAFQPNSAGKLPASFPTEIPVYPNAILQESPPSEPSETGGSARWVSPDSSSRIQSFYQQQFQANNWQVTSRPTDDSGGTFVARRNVLQVTITIQSAASLDEAQATEPVSGSTAILLRYVQADSPQATSTSTPQPGDAGFIGPTLPGQPSEPISSASDSATQSFTDLNKAPAELQQPLKDLAALGVLKLGSSNKKENSTAASVFEPNQPVTRREYARWLFAANNRLQANRPAQQIRAGVKGSQPTFQDISQSDPDFTAIQGLAEAGILPSSLSGNSTVVSFRPEAPLTRETLLLWKVPLDFRQALANASVDAVKQTWGFQDTGRIDPQALRSVLADFQNGDQANIRRVFGYTTLFQPKKAVTRAEAAATLWYFGTASDGISASEVLKAADQSK